MAGGDGGQRRIEDEQAPEALQIDGHVPVGRGDDHGRAAHDVITGEEHAPPRPATSRGGWRRGPGCGRPAGRSRPRPARSRRPRPGRGRNRHGLSKPITLGPRQGRSAAAPGEWSGWVWVTTIQRIRPAAGGGQSLEVTGAGLAARVGPRIDHGQLGRPHQIAVGPRPGHHPRVGRRQPDHPVRQGHGPAPYRRGAGRFSSRGHRRPRRQDPVPPRPSAPMLRMMSPSSAELAGGPRRPTGRARTGPRPRRSRDRRAAGSGSPARRPPPGAGRWGPARRRPPPPAARPLVVKRAMASRFLMVGKMMSNSPARARSSASVGSHPDGGRRLVVVVDGDLARGQGGDEEAGVVALGGRLGGDPVAEVVDPVDGQPQALGPAGVEEADRPGVHLHPAGGQPAADRRVGHVDQGAPGARPLRGRPAGRRPPRSTPGGPPPRRPGPRSRSPAWPRRTASDRPTQASSAPAVRSASSTFPPGKT